jgi:hypothetical protein
MVCRIIRFVPVALICFAAYAEAQSPTGTLSGPAINFGNQAVGTTSAPLATTVTAVIVPPSGYAVRVESVGTSNSEFVVGGGGTCQAGVTYLDNADNCTVQVAFAPSAPGARSGTLSVDCSLLAVVGTVIVVCNGANIALSGVGIAAAALQAIPAVGREWLTALAVLMMLGSMYYLRRRRN